MSYGDDEPGIVCRVTAEGEVICDKVLSCTGQSAMIRVADSSDGLSESADTRFKALVPAGEWGPNKIKLALRILEVLGASDLPEENIPRRSGEIVDSCRQLLAPVPPSILLYNYSTLPANVMGAYFLNKADLVRMQQMFQTFEHPKQP